MATSHTSGNIITGGSYKDKMAFIGTFTLGVEVVTFGMLQFIDDSVIFLTLSYLLRYGMRTFILVHLQR